MTIYTVEATEATESGLDTRLTSDDLDDLDVVRGIVNATALSLPLWAIILTLWFLVTSGGGYP